MPDLVALDLPLGHELIARITALLDAEVPFSVLDHRWSPDLRAVALAALRPTIVEGPDGATTLHADGIEAAPGDAVVLLTSGSTNDPKAAVLTRDAIEASASITSAALGSRSGESRWVACLPPVHIGGLSVILRSILTGVDVVVVDHPDGQSLAAAARSGATHVSLVTKLLDTVDTNAFEKVLLGGAAPPPIRPANVIATYGMTETGSGVVYDGRPLPGVDLALRDIDGEGWGEILISSPTLLRSYRDRPAPLVDGPDHSPGWLVTGDVGRLAVDGSLEVAGRHEDVIVTGGEKVWPDDVEQVLRDIPGVSEVAVWRRSDPAWGHRVVAWIVPDGTPPTIDEVRDVVASRLARYCAPRELVLVDRLPRTPLGKVRRRSLS